MADPSQLPFLLKLIDDESEKVRTIVMDEFESFGTDLEMHLAGLPEPPDAQQRILLHTLLMENRKKLLRREWPVWLRIRNENEKLELAFTLIGDYLNGQHYPVKLKSLLDLLASEYTSMHDVPEVMSLARFLFQTKGLKGADYEKSSPGNSDLVYVLQTMQGLPISLACVYILVGGRLGLDILGCNMPGHFFARVTIDGQVFLVDCYNGGQFFLADEFHPIDGTKSPTIKRIVNSPPDAETIIRRVLMNIIRAYQQADNSEESGFFVELLTSLNERRSKNLI